MNGQDRIPIPIGDLQDAQKYVRRIVGAIARSLPEPLSKDELEEAVLDGLELVAIKAAELGPAAKQSLQRELSTWLEWRIRDRLRERNKWRTGQPQATGLAWEHDGDANLYGGQLAHRDHVRQVEEHDALRVFNGANFHDPRLAGRYFGVPSHRPPGTAAAEEIRLLYEDEREGLDEPDVFIH
jgi:hypothetical protein